jgi:hypothetical protein
MIGRRRLLQLGLGLALLCGVGVVAFGPAAAEAEIVSHLRRRLAFLRLDEQGLHAFARDQVRALLAKRPTWVRWKYHFLHLRSPGAFSPYDRSNDRRSRIERAVDNLASTYLLSSDFFLNSADESRLVRYLRFYDPLRPCGNPFARPVIVPAAGGSHESATAR